MLRTNTNFEREMDGRAQALVTSYASGVEFEGFQSLKSRVTTSIQMQRTGIGPNVLVETESKGPVAVCEITSGEKVLTLENGYQTVLWVGRGKSTEINPSLTTTICISSCTLGKSRHGGAVFFAPDQNILLRNTMNDLFFGSDNVLSKTKYLTHLPGVEQIKNKCPTDWVHLLFDRVEMVQVEGLWVESMVPELQMLRFGPREMCAEIEAAIPSLRYDVGIAAYTHNMPVLNKKEVKMLSFDRL